jgi:predicted transcriptional regulator
MFLFNMADKKFLLLSMDDEKTKDIANAVNNKTSKKILDFLSNGDATETEISEKLNLPISSVHYNLQLLLKTKLVVWDKYHLSEKGKEVKHYSLANKFIIIAPKEEKEGFLDALKKILPAFLVLGLGAFLLEFFNKTLKQNSLGIEEATADNVMVRAVPMAAETEIVAQSNTWFMSEASLYFIFGGLLVLVIVVLTLYINKKIRK